MAAVNLCTFNHGLAIYIGILSLAFAREKNNRILMPNPWLNEHKSTAAMNYFLNIQYILSQTYSSSSLSPRILLSSQENLLL